MVKSMHQPIHIAMIRTIEWPVHLMDKYHDPLHGSIPRVFFYYAAPAVFGLLATSSASLIDAMFLGNFVGAPALAAVNLATPIISTVFALVFMLAIGGSVTAGLHLGAKQDQLAGDVFTKTLATSLGLGVLLSGLALVFLPQVIRSLGANEELAPLVNEYLGVLFWFVPSLIAGVGLYYFVVVDGRLMLASLSLSGSALLNVGLDYWFIVELDAGIQGAAWATGISQILILPVLAPHFFGKRARIRFQPLHGSWSVVFRSAINGFSEFTNEISVAIVTLMFNWVMISRLGTEGVAAFTVVQYLLFLGVMINYGFSEALQPAISKNLGAGQPHRILGFLNVALLSSLVVGLAFAAMLLLMPELLIGLFLQEDAARTAGIAYDFIALFWPAFLFIGINITLTSYFTSLHQPLPSAIIAISRSLILPAILLVSLPHWFGDTGVYLTVPVAEAITLVIAFSLLRRQRLATKGTDKR
jgi:Na+-driven multidrug efflux pump